MDKQSAQVTAEADGSLESRLRGLLLSNVTISNPEATQEASTPGNPRRGRGGYHRNPNRKPPGQPQPAHGHTAAPISPGLRRGYGRGSHQHQGTFQPRRSQQSNVQNPSNAQSANGAEAQASANTQHRSNNQNGQRQNFPSHQSNQGNLEEVLALGARIFQRPRAQGPQAHHNPNHANTVVDPIAQIRHLDALAAEEVPKVEISLREIEEKEVFRKHLELLCQSAVAKAFPDMVTISLVGFGSLASGFATPGSDMDLSVVPSLKDETLAVLYEHSIKQRIPRLLEGAILEANIGGRLLTRTRVPILKVCEKPNETLFKALSDERKKWEELPEAERYIDPPPQPKPSQKPIPGAGTDTATQTAVKNEPATGNSKETTAPSMPSPLSEPNRSVNNGENNGGTEPKERVPRSERAWAREKVLGPLDFPKDGVGIQCDINFENPLGIQNTHLLRCYSLTDPRVRPMVLFVKSWAKRRKINSSYSGTLSSYGWVLMVLHYLVNVAHPPVCPNLQLCAQQPRNLEGLEQMFQESKVGGYEVRYWKDEEEIMQAAYVGRLTQNRQSVGALLRGFFSYYAAVSPGYVYGARPPSFHWTTEVLSLRTPNGIRLKQEKGWTGAKTTISGGKEVRHRYLLAIEDPFELDHNVARTVTHPGIVAIRDEFRRAWRILCAISRNETPSEGGLFDEIANPTPSAPAVAPKETAGQKSGVDGASAAVDGQAATPAAAAASSLGGQEQQHQKQENENSNVLIS